MNTNNSKIHKIIATALAAAVVAATPFAAIAQTDQEKARQKEKNDMRNLGTGLGGAALFSILRGRGTEALILGGGAAYAGKKMEDARKAQEKEKREREDRENQSYRYRNDNSKNSGSRSSVSSRTELGSASMMGNRQPVDVLVNSQKVSFAGDTGAEVIGGHTYVPLRGVLEKLGATVNYDSASRSIVATKGDKTVKLPAEGDATVNGKTVDLDAPAFVMNGRTMVPLRFMAETFDAEVNYNNSDRAVHINSVGSV
ncbi:MAG: copper amine oxidase N-terminal domain-containing protein [Armatimonadota bacterium]